jgi:hypothetical protein
MLMTPGDYVAAFFYYIIKRGNCQKMLHFLHTTILTMCTAKKVNLNLEAKSALEM